FLVQPTPFGEAQIAEGRRAVALLQLTPSKQRALAGVFLALMSYLELVQQTPHLDSIFEKVVDSPSLWSVVRHVGVSATLVMDTEHIQPANTADWNLLTPLVGYDLPMALRLNDKPALKVTLVVVPPRPPFLTCGGIIG